MPSPTKARALKPAKEGQSAKPSTSRKRQSSARISAACEACKKRKTKCTGGPSPCQLCESLGTECVIDLSLDMRRRAALQRITDESKSYQDTLNGILDVIRDGPSPQSDSLVEYIRSGASIDGIMQAIPHLDDIMEEDGDDSMILQRDLIDSSPSENTDNMSMFPSQTDESLRTNGIANYKDENTSPSRLSSSERIRDKEDEDSRAKQISLLLSRLKNLPTSDIEQLLRRPDVSKSHGLWEQSGLSDHITHNRLETFGLNAVPATDEERSLWHPALHLRSRSSWREEQRQWGKAGPFQRRFSDVSSAKIKSEMFSPSLFTDLASRARRGEAGPSIKTDVSLQALQLDSPITPYADPGPTTPRSGLANVWDLDIASTNHTTRMRIPVHLVLPLVVPDDSYLSNMYTNYVDGARQMLETGASLTDVLGANDEVPVDLFFRNRVEKDGWDCASWAAEVCRALVELDECVRLASIFLLTLMMRWLLVPTRENYLKIPDIMKPTPSQRMIPHIGAIEVLPLGPVRDALIYHMRDWLSELGKAKWTVNWPFDLDAAMEQSPMSGKTRLNARFIEHISEYDNWSVGSEFLIAFPELSGRIRIHD